MIDANVKCLTCGNTYVTNHHECSQGCRIEDEKVIHEGFCARCVRRMIKSIVYQIEPKPVLRIEGKTHE